MNRTLKCAIFACAVAAVPAYAAEPDCNKLSVTVKKAVAAKPDNVLAIVERQIASNPSCACEVVKAAIVATEANGKLVGQIVATAVEAAPEQMNVITTCAVAVAPDALPQIKATLAKLDPTAFAKKGSDPVGGGTTVRNPVDEAAYLIPGLQPIHPPLLGTTCTPDEFPNIDLID